MRTQENRILHMIGSTGRSLLQLLNIAAVVPLETYSLRERAMKTYSSKTSGWRGRSHCLFRIYTAVGTLCRLYRFARRIHYSISKAAFFSNATLNRCTPLSANDAKRRKPHWWCPRSRRTARIAPSDPEIAASCCFSLLEDNVCTQILRKTASTSCLCLPSSLTATDCGYAGAVHCDSDRPSLPALPPSEQARAYPA